MSPLPPKADECSTVSDVCYGPIADILFDGPIDADAQASVTRVYFAMQ